MNSGVPNKNQCKRSNKILSKGEIFNSLELTNTMRRMRFPENRSKAKITNLDLALVPVDENVVTLEVSMNNRRIMAVEIEKPLQNLPTPIFDSSNICPLMFQPIPIPNFNKSSFRVEANQSNHPKKYETTNKLSIQLSKNMYEKTNLLSESARSEHFCYKIDVPISSINPRSVEFHNIGVFESFEKMNFTIQSLKIFWTLQKVIKFHLIPGYFNPFILIKSPITARNIQNWGKEHKSRNPKMKLGHSEMIEMKSNIHCLRRPFSKNLIILQSENKKLNKNDIK